MHVDGRRFDVLDQLGRIDCPRLVCVGELDPVTPVDAAREIAEAGRGRGRGRRRRRAKASLSVLVSECAARSR
jgi:pimeloyl-ACP methyl ester carboxylesterase